MIALALTVAAFGIAGRQPGKWWADLASGGLVNEAQGLIRLDEGGVACFWTPSCRPGASLVVISCLEVFTTSTETDAATAASRIAKLVRAGMDGGRIPPTYGPFRSGTKASIFAYDYGAGKSRIVGEAHPKGSGDYYVCGFADKDARDLASYTPDYKAYDASRSAADKCLAHSPSGGSLNSVELDARYQTAGEDIGLTVNWDVWYTRQANRQQRGFIDLPLDKPLRLRGGAGTGKTVTLALKALKLLKDAQERDATCRVLFLTHSWALAEAVDELMASLDPGPVFRDTLRTLEVWPLLYLADSKVQLGASSRRLLGTDSRNGKLEMFRRIGESIAAYGNGDWIARRSGCRPEFRDAMEAAPSSEQHRTLQWDILNEIATVFAAAGIHPRKRADYLKLRRKGWMMALKTDDEKHALLDIYKTYYDGLQRDDLTGPEQLISDYLRTLGSFEWERLRVKEGYDYVFVDEMHLFDEQERFVLHQLLADGIGRPRVAMAMDPQQSALEFFVNLASESSDSSEIYKRANLREPTKVDLTTTFRHTKAIAAFVQSLTEQGMHLQLGDEWETPAAEASSAAEKGALPLLHVHADRRAQYAACFGRATMLARQGERRRCAVICMDDDRFDDYRVSLPVQYAGLCSVVQSEQEVADALHYETRRFLVSLPEYVGGLQFDCVIVMDVNEDGCGGDSDAFQRRRFVTDLYVACSRAKADLELHSTSDRGGMPSLLQTALERKLLKLA